VLLLGPWGPDPRRYMILSGAVQALDEGRLSVMLRRASRVRRSGWR